MLLRLHGSKNEKSQGNLFSEVNTHIWIKLISEVSATKWLFWDGVAVAISGQLAHILLTSGRRCSAEN